MGCRFPTKWNCQGRLCPTQPDLIAKLIDAAAIAASTEFRRSSPLGVVLRGGSLQPE